MPLHRAASARTISLVAIALVALSLGLKYLIMAGPTPLFDKDASLRQVEAAMRDAGFTAQIDPEIPFVLANKGGCQAKLRILTAHGSTRHALARIDATVGPTQYHYRGMWNEKAPKFRPLAAYYFQRELARVGIYRARSPVISAATSTGCGPLSSSLPDLTAIELGVRPKVLRPG